MKESGVWEYDFKVQSFNLDKNRKLNIVSLCEYLQEVAGEHANTKGFGYQELINQTMVWVLNGIKVEVERMPDWEEDITIKTWVVGNDRFISRRDFQWFDSDGNIIINASTNWILYHTVKHRPMLVEKMDFKVQMYPEKLATSLNIQSIKAVFNDIKPTQHTVKYSDLDMVGHMNNTKYVQLILDNYSLEFHNKHAIKSLEINFKTEALYGQELELYIEEVTNENYVHQLRRKADQKVNCNCIIIWKTT